MTERFGGSDELEPTQEVLLPADLAHHLGHGVEQLLKPSLEKVSAAVRELDQDENIVPLIRNIRRGTERIRDISQRLQTAQSVALVSYGEAGWEFRFSEEYQTPRTDKLPQVTYILPEETTSALRSALSHHIRNPLGGFTMAEFIQEDFPTHAGVAQQIIDERQSIVNVLNSFDQANQIRIHTDEAGITTMTPLPPMP